MAALEPAPFEVGGDGPRLAGERMGEGPPVALLHGLTATRRYVVHGSKALARAGFTQISYDARAHGQSEPAPGDAGYTYAEMGEDLGRVLAEHADGPAVLCGDSMGSHTVAAYALAHGEDLAGIVVVRPVALGLPTPPESLVYWDGLADGLEEGGAEGFMRAYEDSLEAAPEFRETILRFTSERMNLHRDPVALARAVRGVPRSVAFDGIAELESLDLPVLVVASRDEADPGHPYAVAEAWTEAIPGATMVSEDEGQSPLAWQGGRLSRAIAEFCATDAVLSRRASP